MVPKINRRLSDKCSDCRWVLHWVLQGQASTLTEKCTFVDSHLNISGYF